MEKAHRKKHFLPLSDLTNNKTVIYKRLTIPFKEITTATRKVHKNTILEEWKLKEAIKKEEKTKRKYEREEK